MREPMRLVVPLSSPVDGADDDVPVILSRLSTSRDLSLTDQVAIAEASSSVSVSGTLGDDWVGDVRALLGSALREEMVGVYDEGALTFRSARWARAVAAGGPLRFTELFHIDAVVRDGELWAHTHGLRRLGLIELELHGNPDDVSFAGAVINNAARAMLAAGVPEPGEPLRVGRSEVVAWQPWDSFDWGEDELGGPEAREAGSGHEGPAGVLVPLEADAPLADGLELVGDGVRLPDVEPTYEVVARATAADAFEAARSVPSRSMWLTTGEVEGTVLDAIRDGFVIDHRTVRREVALAEVIDWGVTARSGFSLGPWSAHSIDVIEDIEAGWRSRRDEQGRLLCNGCQQPLTSVHSCG